VQNDLDAHGGGVMIVLFSVAEYNAGRQMAQVMQIYTNIQRINIGKLTKK